VVSTFIEKSRPRTSSAMSVKVPPMSVPRLMAFPGRIMSGLPFCEGCVAHLGIWRGKSTARRDASRQLGSHEQASWKNKNDDRLTSSAC
jgi:hypothetical protein